MTASTVDELKRVIIFLGEIKGQSFGSYVTGYHDKLIKEEQEVPPGQLKRREQRWRNPFRTTRERLKRRIIV
jgi:hypothetical protein